MTDRPSAPALHTVAAVAAAQAVGLPAFGPRSEVPWRRSGTARWPLPTDAPIGKMVAAVAAALAARQEVQDGPTTIRFGVAGEGDAVVPLVAGRPSDGETWEAWCARIRGASDQARAFADLSIVEQELLIGKPSGTGRRQLFRILVEQAHSPGERPLLNDITVGANGTDLVATYDNRLLDAHVVDELLEDVEALLALPPDAPVLGTSASAEDLVVPVAPEPVDVIAAFLATATALPDEVAVADASGEITYAELRSQVEGVSSAVRSRGCAPGDVVALLAYPGREMVALLLGLLHGGTVPAVLDLQSPAARLSRALVTMEARLCIADEGSSSLASRAVPNGVRVVRADEVLAAGVAAPVAVDPAAPGYVLLTSGSTGVPKAVVQTRRTLSSIVEWQVERSGSGSRLTTVQRSALSFDVALQEILSTLCDGGRLEVLPDHVRGDFSALASFVREKAIQRMFIPPSGLQALVAASDSAQLTSLEEVICAGEPLVVSSTIRLAFRAIGSQLDNQYGPTETHVATAARLEGDPYTWPDHPPIGCPLPGMAVSVEAETGPVRLGVPGELVIAGRTVALGYAGSPSDRFASLGPDRPPTFRSGDIVRMVAGGALEHLGRCDDQVKVRGYRVELGEVEAAALATGMARQAACAVRRSGSTDRLILAVAGDAVNEERLLTALRSDLPAYMVPRPAEVLTLPDLPRTTSGKVDRAAIVAEFESRSASTDRGDGDARGVALVWRRCLGVDSCGPDESFVDLGGDSLAAVELSAALSDIAGYSVSLRRILDGLTLRQLETMVIAGPASAADARTDGPAPSDLTQIDLPTIGTVWCGSATEARHLYVDVVICAPYGPLDELNPKPTVIDVGANVGIFSLAVLAARPAAQVIAVEPHPLLAEALRRNLNAGATTIEAAVSTTLGGASLHTYGGMAAMSSLTPNEAYDLGLMELLLRNEVTRTGGSASTEALRHHVIESLERDIIPVATTTLAAIIAEEVDGTIDLLKVDVQHGELDVLASVASGQWPRVRRVVVETQDTGGRVQAVADLLRSAGFVVAVRTFDLVHRGTGVRFVDAARST